MRSVNFIYIKEIKSILEINKNPDMKFQEIKMLTSVDSDRIDSKEFLEKITNAVMKTLKKSDYHFLLWLHCCGEYVKTKNNGKWALIKCENSLGKYYEPIIINGVNEVWRIGESCRNLYYLKNRATGITFDLFYKLDIERVIYQPNLADLGVKKDEIIYPE